MWLLIKLFVPSINQPRHSDLVGGLDRLVKELTLLVTFPIITE